ncbi:TPM domain-containing protein [Orbaceae bacterium ac157xtp]
MKKIITSSLLIFISYFCICLCSFADNNRYPAMQDAVTDTVKLLSPAEFRTLNNKIMALENETGAQLGVLIIDSTKKETIERYANNIFNQWQLGRKGIDDGVLLLVALKDRTVRIEVGYGLEGQITDIYTQKVINEYLIPYFKQERYYQGIDKAVDVLIAKIKQEPLPKLNKIDLIITTQSDAITWIDFLAIYLIGGSILFWIGGLYRLLKTKPLKSSITVAIIVTLTWYAGGFDFSTWNGLNLGYLFSQMHIPLWVQVLFMQLFPAWVSIIMIITCIAVILFTLLFGIPYLIFYLTKNIKSKKIRVCLINTLNISEFVFIFVFIITSQIIYTFSLQLSIGVTLLVALLTFWGTYKGKIHFSSLVGSRERSSYKTNGSSHNHSNIRSGSRSSGGGGRSGGGGSSGRW